MRITPPPSRQTLTPADREHHLLPIAQIVSDQYAGGQYVNEISQQYIGNCHYDWDTTRLIWDEDRLIHHWGIWGYPMRLESVQLRVAGVGAVVTREAYREQGLMQRAALASLEAMREKGYDLSILRGRHYVKFGYARAWNYVTYRLKPEEVPDAPLKHPYQKLGAEHIREMDVIYNETHRTFSGTAVRPTYQMKSAEDLSAYGWFNEDLKLDGYVRALPPEDEKDNLQCLEAAGDPLQALAVMNDLFKQGEYKIMTFFTLPPLHPLLQVLRGGNCIVETRYFAISGWRVRIVNLHSTLEKLLPLIEARLQHSRFEDWCGELSLDAGEQKASLQIEKGAIQVVNHLQGQHNLQAGPALARLLIGSDEPDEIIRQEGIRCEGMALELARTLFPNLHPMMSQWDEV